jgi:hypothetical protein
MARRRPERRQRRCVDGQRSGSIFRADRLMVALPGRRGYPFFDLSPTYFANSRVSRPVEKRYRPRSEGQKSQALLRQGVAPNLRRRISSNWGCVKDAPRSKFQNLIAGLAHSGSARSRWASSLTRSAFPGTNLCFRCRYDERYDHDLLLTSKASTPMVGCLISDRLS